MKITKFFPLDSKESYLKKYNIVCQQKIHTFARSDSVVTKKMTAERRKLLGLSTKE